MNTLLHVFEAYTELYRVSGDEKVRRAPAVDHGYCSQRRYTIRAKQRQEVFLMQAL
ncbi:MAG: hypothetical protein ACLVCH_12825 [Roseburia inulinivorans]